MPESAKDFRKEFGSYEVESVLGRGAMGMVYLARDRRIGRKVALKTVHVDERFDDDTDANEFFKRLQREAELCGSLQHPNIVTLYEPGYEDGVIAWLATEYIDGESLRDRMKKRKPLPLQEALRVTEDLLKGLAFAHAKGVIHRDIKPANILLTAEGQAKIADFGIARPLDSNLTAVGEMLGTPSYMSPEQVKCTAVTARSDLFSLGAVLYEMVTGVKAFAAGDVSGILRNVIEHEPRPVHVAHAQVPAALSPIVARLLAKDPQARYPNATAALHDIQQLRATLGIADDEVEEIRASAGVSTLASHSQGSVSETQPSITSISTDDMTPAIGQPGAYRPPFDRPVPAPVFFGVIVALLIIVGGSATAIHLQSDPSPTVAFTAAELEALRQKQDALSAARSSYGAGRLEEALKRYDAYLAQYPASVVAAEERAETVQAMQAMEKESAAVAAEAPAKRVTSTKKAEPPKRRGFFDRLFRRP